MKAHWKMSELELKVHLASVRAFHTHVSKIGLLMKTTGGYFNRAVFSLLFVLVLVTATVTNSSASGQKEDEGGLEGGLG